MAKGRTKSATASDMERLGAEHHRESLKRDLIRMSRGDHDTPLLTARKRASSSLSDLLVLAPEGPLQQDTMRWRLAPE